MYSIVMLAAMTATPETPDCGLLRCIGQAFHNTSYSSGCTGCYGSGRGSSSSYGSCYGSSSCYGSGYGCYGSGYSSCTGCTGHAAYYGSCQGYGTYAAPAMPTSSFYTDVPAGFSPTTTPGEPQAVTTLPPSRGQIVVTVPVDAKLYADGQATSLTGSERAFLTPDIATGRDFQYTLKVEYAVNGEPKSASKQVIVRAGHRTAVDFTAPVEKASSPVTIDLPEKAKLFVDGQETQATGGRHDFRTPPLTKGKPYVYQFRAEIERNGRTEVRTQKVVFEAGDAVRVDFTEAAAVRTASK